MSQVTVFNAAELPAHLRKAALSEATKALMGNPSGYRLSIKAGAFRLLSNGKEYQAIEERSLNVVVVAAAPHVARTFYMAKYDEETAGNAPECYSKDGETPDPKSRAVQSATCQTCPQNAKGSGQGDSRACRFNQALAVVLENDMSGNVLKFQVPAASIFGKGEGANVPLREYVTQLAQVSANVDMVVTKMKFDLSASSPKLFFSPVRYLSESEYAACQQQGQSLDAKHAVEFTVAETDGVKQAAPVIAGAAPKLVAPEPKAPPSETAEEREAREWKEWKAAKAAKATPAAAPAPKVGRPKKIAGPADEPVAEPTVRAAPVPAVAPGRANLAALIDQWNGPDEA